MASIHAGNRVSQGYRLCLESLRVSQAGLALRFTVIMQSVALPALFDPRK